MAAPPSVNQTRLQIEAVLAEAAQSVLEIMFFAESERVPPQTLSCCPRIHIEIRFEGHRCGRFDMDMPQTCAQAMAASFEGIPDTAEIAPASVDAVAGELANMICGASLTRLEGNGLFRLGSPRLTRSAAGPERPSDAECWLRIPYMGDAILHLAWELEERP